MKLILGLATLAFAILVLEERTRQIAGEAQEVIGETATQARDASHAVIRGVKQRPLATLLIASGLGFVLARLTTHS